MRECRVEEVLDVDQEVADIIFPRHQRTHSKRCVVSKCTSVVSLSSPESLIVNELNLTVCYAVVAAGKGGGPTSNLVVLYSPGLPHQLKS